MKKILPITLDTGITTECWTLYRLAAILTDEKFLPWYVEKFINTTMLKNYCVEYYPVDLLECQCVYDEVLDFREIVDGEDIVSAIVKGINEGGYTLLYYDRYYVEESIYFHKEHNIHDTLVLGYDDQKQEFYFINMNIDGSKGVLWEKNTIKYSSLSQSFYSALKIMRKENWFNIYRDNGPASTFYLRDFNRKPQVTRIYDTIEMCLRGGEYIGETSTFASSKTSQMKYGVSIYKGYYDDLYKKLLEGNIDILAMNNNMALNKVKTIYESKKGLIYRLKYLYDKSLICMDKAIVADLETLCENVMETFNLLSKYYYSLNNNYLDRACKKFREIEQLDIYVLGKVRELIYKSVKV